MPSKQVAYPVPVLGNGDDIAGSFSCVIQFRVQDNAPLLKGKFSSDNGSFAVLVEKGQANYCLLIESGRTFYRQNFYFAEPGFELQLPKSDIRERITIYPSIIATKEISRYSPSGLNADFVGMPIRVAAGEVLAVAPKQEIIPDTEFSGKLGDPQSIFIIKLDRDLEGDLMKPYFHSDQINIKLSRSLFDLYHAIKSKPDIIHAMIAFPVLAEAIRILDDKQYVDYRWNVALRGILEQHGLDIENHLEAAQIIFGSPTKRGLEASRSVD